MKQRIYKGDNPIISYNGEEKMPAIERPIDERSRIVLLKDILKNWGDCAIVRPNTYSIIVHPKSAKLGHVIRSTEILLEDLRHGEKPQSD